jgi:hypothetical protein
MFRQLLAIIRRSSQHFKVITLLMLLLNIGCYYIVGFAKLMMTDD